MACWAAFCVDSIGDFACCSFGYVLPAPFGAIGEVSSADSDVCGTVVLLGLVRVTGCYETFVMPSVTGSELLAVKLVPCTMPCRLPVCE